MIMAVLMIDVRRAKVGLKMLDAKLSFFLEKREYEGRLSFTEEFGQKRKFYEQERLTP